MKELLIVLGLLVAGCTAFDPVYRDVARHQQSRDSQGCIDRVDHYLGKGYFADNQKAELYLLRGICYNQIGMYDKSMESIESAVNISEDTITKAKALFERGLLLLLLAGNDTKYSAELSGKGCADMAESCRLVPEKYCSEYTIKKQPPANCR